MGAGGKGFCSWDLGKAASEVATPEDARCEQPWDLTEAPLGSMGAGVVGWV